MAKKITLIIIISIIIISGIFFLTKSTNPNKIKHNKFKINSNSVYFEEKIINNADPTTFTLLKNNSFFSAIDKNYLYFISFDQCESKGISNVCIPTNKLKKIKKDKICHFQSFNKINQSNYSKDKKCVYLYFNIIKDADPKTFKIIKNYYSKDAHSVFYKNKKIENIDSNSFKIISKDLHYTKDKNNIYFDNKKIIGADVETFKIIDDPINHFYAKDKNNVYSSGKIIKGLKPEMFNY